MMMELSGTALLVAVIVLCVYLRRWFAKKSLDGSTVLVRNASEKFNQTELGGKLKNNFCNSQITNGGNELSLNLANQLSHVHKCKVILVKQPSSSNNNEIHRLECHTSENISTFECDILVSSQMDQLSTAIDKQFPGIDLIIDNGLAGQTQHHSPEEFITSTSNSLRATINVRHDI